MKGLIIATISVFVLANFTFAKDMQNKQEKIAAELTNALNQQKKENDKKAQKTAETTSTEATSKYVLNEYPEYLGTALEPILIEKVKANPNFTIENIDYDSNGNILINNQKVLDKNEDVINRINLLKKDPNLMNDYRKILREHYYFQNKIHSYISGYFGQDYKPLLWKQEQYTVYTPLKNKNLNDLDKNIPMACKHKISYVNKADFMGYKPQCTKRETRLGKNKAVEKPIDDKTLTEIYKNLPEELVMVDDIMSFNYVKPAVSVFTAREIGPLTYYKYFYNSYECVPYVVENDIFDIQNKPWKNKTHTVKVFSVPEDYKCEDTLAKVAKYGIK